MKKIHPIILCFVLVIISISTSFAADLKSDAIKNLQKEVIKALPAEGNIIRIGVTDFEGDDGTIKNAITSAITEKTSFKVIERADLDRILKEQGLQLKDIMDEKTKVRHGMIKGVQGLLIGKVQGMESGFLSYNIKVQLKLDDVEKGEIVFSKDFTVSAVSPIKNWLIAAIIIIIILIFLVPYLKRRNIEVKETIIKDDVKARVDITRDISRAASNIKETKSKLMDMGKTSESVMLKDAERELLLFKDKVESAARGNSDTRSRSELNDVLYFDNNYLEELKELADLSEKIHTNVISGSQSNLSEEIARLKKAISLASNRLKGRKI